MLACWRKERSILKIEFWSFWGLKIQHVVEIQNQLRGKIRQLVNGCLQPAGRHILTESQELLTQLCSKPPSCEVLARAGGAGGSCQGILFCSTAAVYILTCLLQRAQPASSIFHFYSEMMMKGKTKESWEWTCQNHHRLRHRPQIAESFWSQFHVRRLTEGHAARWKPSEIHPPQIHLLQIFLNL